MTDQIQQVAVVGAGYMGGGIAQVLAMAGLDVVIVDAAPDITQRHLDRLCREAEEFEQQGLFDPGRPSWSGRTCGRPRACPRRWPTPT